MNYRVSENDVNEFAKRLLGVAYRHLQWERDLQGYVSEEQVCDLVRTHCSFRNGEYLCSPKSLEQIIDEIAHITRSAYLAELAAAGIARHEWDDETQDNAWVIDVDEDE